MRPYIPRQNFRCGTVVTAGLSPSDEDLINKLPTPWKENAQNLLAKDPKKLDAPTLSGAKNMYNLFMAVPSDNADYTTYMNAARVLKDFLHQAEPTNPLFAPAAIFPTDTGATAKPAKKATDLPSVASKDSPASTLPAPPTPETPPSIWNSNVTKGVAIAGVALLAGVAIAKMA